MANLDFHVDDAFWVKVQKIDPRNFTCANCGNLVSSSSGYCYCDHDYMGTKLITRGSIYICPHCNAPTIFDKHRKHFPQAPFGRPVEYVPDDINELYQEARECTSAGAFTAAVMLCRKILMHLAVEGGAEAGESFQFYVEYLAKKGYVPPNGKEWVDCIRDKGNEANHEIAPMKSKDAKDIISFIEMLLIFNYEYPNRLKPDQPKGT